MWSEIFSTFAPIPQTAIWQSSRYYYELYHLVTFEKGFKVEEERDCWLVYYRCACCYSLSPWGTRYDWKHTDLPWRNCCVQLWTGCRNCDLTFGSKGAKVNTSKQVSHTVCGNSLWLLLCCICLCVIIFCFVNVLVYMNLFFIVCFFILFLRDTSSWRLSLCIVHIFWVNNNAVAKLTLE